LRTVARGESLYRAGDPFSHVYVVRHGAFKTVSTTDASAPHVNGLRFVGEVLGLEGAANDRYKDHAVALESSAVCVISFALLEGLASEAAPVQRAVHRLMSADMARESAVIMMLTMRSERRVAMFLLDVLQRMPAHRVQHGEGGVVAFALPLSRAELGSYLGLRLETISRVISSFQEAGLIAISRKGITIYQPQALAAL
jgi:CRP/FNR family transcriptional regulator